MTFTHSVLFDMKGRIVKEKVVLADLHGDVKTTRVGSKENKMKDVMADHRGDLKTVRMGDKEDQMKDGMVYLHGDQKTVRMGRKENKMEGVMADPHGRWGTVRLGKETKMEDAIGHNNGKNIFTTAKPKDHNMTDVYDRAIVVAVKNTIAVVERSTTVVAVRSTGQEEEVVAGIVSVVALTAGKIKDVF